MKTLKLTSPYMHGPDVLRTQQAMTKRGWMRGELDSVYGPITAQAAYRSKHWLGYVKPDQVAGDALLAYLEERRRPTRVMEERTRQRKAAAATVPVRVKALNYLAGKIGDKEFPAGSNRVEWASGWYGLIGPWCAMAVTRAYVEAGSKAFVRAQRYAYVPYVVNDAHAGANNLALTNDPLPGDLVCFDWQGDGLVDHIGLFVRWTDTKRSQLETVEGNTATGNDSNGGEVMRRTRTRAQVRAFVHVGA